MPERAPSTAPSLPRAERATGFVVLGFVTLALFLAGLLLAVLRDAERLRAEDALGFVASDLASDVVGRADRLAWMATHVGGLYEASDVVTRDEFQAFTAKALREHPSVRWVAWIASPVPGQADGPALTYVEPATRSGLRGRDLAAVAGWTAALDDVARTGRVGVFALPSLDPLGAGAPALVVIAPVRPHGPVASAAGSSVGAPDFVAIEAEPQHLLAAGAGGTLALAVLDDRGQPVVSDAAGLTDAEARAAAPHARTVALDLAPRPWRLTVTPNAGYVTQRRTAVPWLVFAATALAVLTTALYVYFLRRATRRATRAAAELRASQRALEAEVRERQLLEARARQAQRLQAMGTLAGGIAHDFNNILCAILGYTDLALDATPAEHPNRAYLTEVEQAGRRARDLVAQILAFSRQTVHERRPMRLDAVVKEALGLLRGSIPPTVEIRAEIDADSPAVEADPTEIHQIVMNLCTNGYQAMRAGGGVLTVSLHATEVGEDDARRDGGLAPGRHVRLTVSDTGVGMPPEVMRRVFEPYFTTRDVGEGTGLGLATVHGLVSGMGGTIHVYSEVGHGTTFSVFLPARADGAEVAAAARGEARGLGGRERVLVVDDEAAIAGFAEAALTRLGYQVTARTRPRDALALFEGDPTAFDVVVTDQMMPALRGVDLARALKRVRADVPIVLASGFGEAAGQGEGDAGLFAANVIKPMVAAELAAAIRRAVAPPTA